MGKESLKLKASVGEVVNNFCICEEYQKQNCREPQERHGPVGEGPEEGHKNDLRDGTPLL